MGGLWHCFTHIIGDHTTCYIGDDNNIVQQGNPYENQPVFDYVPLFGDIKLSIFTTSTTHIARDLRRGICPAWDVAPSKLITFLGEAGEIHCTYNEM